MIQYSRTPMSNHGDNEAYLRGVYDARFSSAAFGNAFRALFDA